MLPSICSQPRRRAKGVGREFASPGGVIAVARGAAAHRSGRSRLERYHFDDAVTASDQLPVRSPARRTHRVAAGAAARSRHGGASYCRRGAVGPDSLLARRPAGCGGNAHSENGSRRAMVETDDDAASAGSARQPQPRR